MNGNEIFHRQPGLWAYLLLLLLLEVTGCAPTTLFQPRQWSEEVKLRSGEMIVVQREIVGGRAWYSESRHRAYRRENILRLPDGTVWDGRAWNPVAQSLEPLLVDRDDRSWILVAEPVFYGDHVRLGCPIPNFLYLRFSTHGWHRVNPVDVPDDLHFNLLMHERRTSDPDGTQITWREKEKLNKAWLEAERLKDNKSYRAYAKLRYTWMNPLGYLVTFDKYCDPAVSDCKQERDPECDPTKLLRKPAD